MDKKKTKKKRPDIDIKVRNIDKMIKADKKKVCASSGCGNCGGFWIFGSALAMILSFDRSLSILWAIFHGILSWFYVAYRAMQIWGWM
jgi:hypothetical protein